MVDKVAIVTDSVACIPPELIKEYDIGVVPIQLIFGDKTYRDGVDISPTEFYVMLRQAEKLPTTAGALPGAYLETLRRASEKADNIFYITLSVKLSGVFDSAKQAIRILTDEKPSLNVELLDSEAAAAAQGLLVLAVARAAASGKDMKELLEIARDLMPRVRLFVMVDTLEYLHRGGHVPKIASLATSLLKIKPIITLRDGEAVPITNPRTNSGAIKRIIKMMEQRVVTCKPLHVAVTHADALEEALFLREQISSRFDCAELLIMEFTPVMGAHTGPGVIGLAFYCED
ncbi:DegV family protein [Chloroflexota bacterium]